MNQSKGKLHRMVYIFSPIQDCYALLYGFRSAIAFGAVKNKGAFCPFLSRSIRQGAGIIPDISSGF